MADDEKSREETHREEMKKLKAEQDAKVRAKEIRRGVLIVNTGHGKGKSTAGFGVAIRAAGHGQKVGLVQFIKGTWKTGEKEALKRFPEITHVVSGDGFTWNTQDLRQDIASARQGWEAAKQMMADESYDVVILDELNIAIRYDYLPIEEVVDVLKEKREALSVVVTGRDAKPELIEIADTVTEMVNVKHAFDSGIKARKGIDF